MNKYLLNWLEIPKNKKYLSYELFPSGRLFDERNENDDGLIQN